jgi:hypothetical protein
MHFKKKFPKIYEIPRTSAAREYDTLYAQRSTRAHQRPQATAGWMFNLFQKIESHFLKNTKLFMKLLCGTIQHAGIRSGEFLSIIPRGVGASGLRSTGRTQCVLPVKRNPNTHTPPTIGDKNSPNSVSCRIGFSTLYPSSRGQTGQLQDQWPWWQRTFLSRVSPKSHGVCACLRPSDPRSP